MKSLEYMLSCYFHQDWDHSHQTWEAVVDDFLKDDPTQVDAVPGEIEELLGRVTDDVELESALMALGMAYDPDEGDRAWLAAVRDRILASGGGRVEPSY